MKKYILSLIIVALSFAASGQSFYAPRYEGKNQGPAWFVGKSLKKVRGKIKQKFYYAKHRRRVSR